jgi:hypothetical protein
LTTLDLPVPDLGEDPGEETDEIDFPGDSDALGEWKGDGVLV